MVFPSVPNPPKQRNATFDDCLDVRQPTALTDLASDLTNKRDLEFGETNVTASFKKRKYKVHMAI